MNVIAKEFTLVKPFKFVVKERVIDQIPKGFVLLKPVVAGICGSEILYFKGEKEEWKLKERLPLCLLHEGVAEVVETSEDVGIESGTYVVVNPMIPCGKCNECVKIGENYCQNSKYMGSTADGLARTYLLYPSSRIIPVPKGVELEVAALTEPLSIAVNAFELSEARSEEKISIIGDGPIGYMVTLIASHVGKVPKERLFMMGIIDEKLFLAEDFASTVNTASERIEKFWGFFDVVFEAVGGRSHRFTIEEAINILKSGGRCIALGLSQGEILVDFNKIVNKGLTIKGSVRSRMEHYRKVLNLLQNREFKERVQRIISKKKFVIKTPEDLYEAFKYADTEEGEAKSKPGRVLVYLS